MFRLRVALIVPALAALPAVSHAGPTSDVDRFSPWDNLGWPAGAHVPQVRTVDLSAQARAQHEYVTQEHPRLQFEELDLYMSPEARAGIRNELENADKHGIVLGPDDMPDEWEAPPPEPSYAFEDIPGNAYPRKATLFLNFFGGMIYNASSENSAEDASAIGKDGMYPTWVGGNARATSIAQSVAADLAPYGVRLVYMERPPKMLPYTMEMMGGDACQDIQQSGDTPCGAIGGVAASSDCGALNQRHIVYTFGEGASTVQSANTAAQEAGHAWGLDHVVDCTSVMSYCVTGDGSYTDGCAGFCTTGCQANVPIGCTAVHEEFCGEGSGQQNDAAEMTWLFGGNEPDMEPPTVEIVEPMDGLEIDAGGDIDLRAIVDDNYGGFGWQFTITKDDEVIFDQPDYERDVDPEYRAALNLTNLEAGVYTLTVEAMDHNDGFASDTVTVYVGGATTTSDSGSGTDSGTDSGSGTSDGSTSSDSGTSDGGSGTDSDTAAVDGGDKGGCSVAGRPDTGLFGLMLILLGAGIRRRTR